MDPHVPPEITEKFGPWMLATCGGRGRPNNDPASEAEAAEPILHDKGKLPTRGDDGAAKHASSPRFSALEIESVGEDCLDEGLGDKQLLPMHSGPAFH